MYFTVPGCTRVWCQMGCTKLLSGAKKVAPELLSGAKKVTPELLAGARKVTPELLSFAVC